MPFIPFSVRLLFRSGSSLYRKNFTRLFGIAVSFLAVGQLLDRLEYYGLFGVFHCISCVHYEAATHGIVFPDLGHVSFPGTVGPISGILGIFSLVISILAFLALVRALSLAYHNHASSLSENARFGSSRFWAFNMYLLRSFFYIVFWPLIAALIAAVLLYLATVLFPLLFVGQVVEKIQRIGLLGAGIVLAGFMVFRAVQTAYGNLIVVDQGLSSKEALDESHRLTQDFWWLTLFYLVSIGLVLFVPESLLVNALSEAYHAKVATGLADALDAVLDVLTSSLLYPLFLSYAYVLYRAILQVKGGAVKEAGRRVMPPGIVSDTFSMILNKKESS